jgi:hypothetical protein
MLSMLRLRGMDSCKEVKWNVACCTVSKYNAAALIANVCCSCHVVSDERVVLPLKCIFSALFNSGKLLFVEKRLVSLSASGYICSCVSFKEG